jgi:serine/threonine protein kinase/TolB-like protein/tetratricopeptide (TPR) repeat protein
MIGHIVIHYRILDKIGEGGMGVVYRAEDIRLGRQVAVKFLSAHLSRDPLALERFQREARAASSLNHPHICALHDVGQHGNRPFLVMELLDGDSLRRRIGGRPLPLDVLLELGVQIADGLDAAHALGIVHRDIKAANIYVTGRGQAKIVDFGLAKLAAGRLDASAETTTLTPGTDQTGTGQTLGTLSYMSPEQARGEELDARSDLFSFGAVLYEMATGREAFTGKTSALVFDAILRQTPPRPSAFNPEVSPELDRTIFKALEKDRDLRYQTAAEIRADLKRVRRDSDSGFHHAAWASGSAVTVAEPSRSHETAAEPSRPSNRTAAEPTGRPWWRRPWPAVAALVAVLTAAILYVRFAPPTAIESVAVLPFVASDTGGDTEYLSDGVTETLINGLSQLQGLRVSARSLVFRFKGASVDALQAGRDLRVAAVVTGRISIRGDRLVVQTELVNVADGAQVWGGQYNRPLSDLLVVQDEIASEILDTLRPRLSGEDRQRAVRRYTDDVRAYQLYLQGRYHWHKGTIEGYQNAIGYFQSAIRADPGYALAYAGLADSELLLGGYWVESIPEAKTAAERAMALDPNLAEAHVALGHIKLLLDWDWGAAASEFQKGIALDPGSALAHDQYAVYLAIVNRLPEALTETRRALELEPLSPIVNADLGLRLLDAGRTQDAIAQFRRTLEIDSNSVAVAQGLGLAYSLAGQHDDAVKALERALVLSGNSPVVLGYLGAAYARQGDRAGVARILADLQALSARAYVPATSFAVVHAALDDHDQAMAWLERAYEEHDFLLPRVGVAPWFRSLAGDGRLVDLLARLNLPR